MKNERSIPFSQSWCSLVATDVCRNPAPKKRFLDEYESSLCYRKSAKEIIQKGLFLDIVNVQAQKRVEAVKVAAVVYFLMFGNQTPAYTKLLTLFGREYARMTYGPMLTKPLYYTGITRAKKNLVLIGDEEAFKKAIRANRTQGRKSLLGPRIIKRVKETEK